MSGYITLTFLCGVALDLSVYFRQQNSSDREKKSMEPTKEQVALFAKLMKEVFG